MDGRQCTLIGPHTFRDMCFRNCAASDQSCSYYHRRCCSFFSSQVPKSGNAHVDPYVMCIVDQLFATRDNGSHNALVSGAYVACLCGWANKDWRTETPKRPALEPFLSDNIINRGKLSKHFYCLLMWCGIMHNIPGILSN